MSEQSVNLHPGESRDFSREPLITNAMREYGRLVCAKRGITKYDDQEDILQAASYYFVKADRKIPGGVYRRKEFFAMTVRRLCLTAQRKPLAPRNRGAYTNTWTLPVVNKSFLLINEDADGDGDYGTTPSSEESVLSCELSEPLDNLIRDLPEHLALPLNWCFTGLSYDEIQSQFGFSRDAARSRVQRFRKFARKYLREQGFGGAPCPA